MTSAPKPPPVTPVTPPPRTVVARPLGWRNPWTRLLGALAAFQAGVIATLLWTSTRGGDGAERERVVEAAPVTLPAGAMVRPGGGPVVGADRDPRPDPSPNSSPNPNPNPSPSPNPSPNPNPHRPAGGHKPPAGPAATPDAGPPVDAAEAAMVEVEVESEPEGATVRIGGAVWGVTPLTALLPSSGRVVVSLELAGHQPARLTWSPATGRRALRAVLVPVESP